MGLYKADHFDWSQANIDRLRDLWTTGATASAIATALGNPSRSSIIAKAARIGLPGRPSPITHKADGQPRVARTGPRIRRPYQRRSTPENRPKPPRVRAVEPSLPLVVIPRKRQAPVVENPGAVRFDALVAGQCRWIPGETVRGHAHESMACGDKVAGPGCPWCASHTERARGRVVGSVEGLSGIDRSAFRAVRVA